MINGDLEADAPNSFTLSFILGLLTEWIIIQYCISAEASGSLALASIQLAKSWVGRTTFVQTLEPQTVLQYCRINGCCPSTDISYPDLERPDTSVGKHVSC